MADVKWIKITTDIFDDEKILLIESLPDSYAIITVWFKLLCLAGKQNNSGVFMLGNIAYTDKMLATIFRMKESTVTMALQTFEQFEMIEIIDGVISIPNWGKHQNLDQLENKKRYMRNYMQEYRKKQKALTCKDNCKTNSETNVSQADIEEDKDKERDEEKEYILVSKDTNCQTDVQRVIEAWNELESFGIKPISRLSPTSQRYKSLVARIKENGLEDVLGAIERIKRSDFLRGRNKTGWTIAFDWFVLPNNFPKVLEGNYDKGEQGNEQSGSGDNSPTAITEQEEELVGDDW